MYIMERNSNLTKLARELRKNQTKEESLLWYNFLSKYSPRFHRQYVIGNYIVDFYCHQAKLVVELDGSQHYEPEEMEKDRFRTECPSSRPARARWILKKLSISLRSSKPPAAAVPPVVL